MVRDLTAQFAAAGRPLRWAECVAAVLVTACLAVSSATGYRSGDAERERLPGADAGPATRPMAAAGRCGTDPAGVDRDGIFSECRPGPSGTAGRGERGGRPGPRQRAAAGSW